MIQSICPGCSVGCGLYVVKDGEKIDIDYRKRSPVNEGKICKFGVKLPKFYSKERATAMVKEGDSGKEVELDLAIEEAAKRLKEVRDASGGDSIAIITGGSATNEELLALKALADSIGSKNIECGLGKFSSLGSEVLKIGLPFKEVEKAKNIILILLDPFVSYPLLSRNILNAKKNGAKVLNIGVAENKVADKTVIINPGEQTVKLQSLVKYLKDKSGDDDFKEIESFFEESVIISDLNPLSDPEAIKAISNVGAVSGSKLLFMKPYANLSGAAVFGFVSNENGIDGILSDIDEGKIKALYIFESDLVGTALDEAKAAETLGKLDLLVVQSSINTKTTGLADVSLPVEPFFEKKGTVINAEGRALSNKGKGTNGLEVIGKIADSTGGKGMDYEAAHSKVLEELGITLVNEDKIPLTREDSIAEIEMGEAETKEGDQFLVLKANPFFWNGVASKHVLEMGVSNVNRLGLFKGESVKIKSNGSEEIIGFKVSDLPEGIVVSEAKLSPSKDLISEVSVEKIDSA